MSDRKQTQHLNREVADLQSRIRELESELQKRVIHTTHHTTDRYRALFEQSADAILIIAGDTFVDCNQATVDMLRYRTKQELLETHPSELSPPTQPDGRSSYEKANEMIAIAFEQGNHRFEWDHKRADGEVFPVEVLLTPIPDEHGTKLHVVWRDITERRQLESQLRQAQKMEAIGKLAGGIAHDFNNLLVAINGNAELLQEEVRNNAEMLDLTRQIRWAGERAAELTRQLLAFSRKQVLQTKVLDLNKVIADITKMLGRLIGEDIQLVTHPSQSPVLLKADPGQIEQVLINLTSNSRDAMPDGGTLTLGVEARRIEQGLSTGSLSLDPGDYVRLTVIDTGSGMDEETRRRAFDPFFTTKGPGEGTGLGLATVYGIVKQSGGNVTLHSTPGKGATVEVWFPATTEAPATDLPAPPTSGSGGDETILVVEDEGTVATLVYRLLQREGYTVLQSHNGLEALDLYEARHEDIDLILADVVMPHMGGPELIRRLRERGHSPLVIFASGYSDGTDGSLDRLGGHTAFLQKPFSPRELLRCVRLALDRVLRPAKPTDP
jgi:two-component system cell cycle sensor histidine kinase/response regulator CckA